MKLLPILATVILFTKGGRATESISNNFKLSTLIRQPCNTDADYITVPRKLCESSQCTDQQIVETGHSIYKVSEGGFCKSGLDCANLGPDGKCYYNICICDNDTFTLQFPQVLTNVIIFRKELAKIAK